MTSTTKPLWILLERLDHVKKYGDGYRAKCPAHDGESSNSLSVSEADDGTVLIKCFGQCESLNVLHSIGLEFSDLFPNQITPDMSPVERKKALTRIRERTRLSALKAAASALELEAIVIGMFGNKLQLLLNEHGHRIESDFADGDIERFHLAQDRVHRIASEISGL
jgi:hypothetical protein